MSRNFKNPAIGQREWTFLFIYLLLILYRIHIQMLKKNKYNYRQGRYGDSEGLVIAN